MKNETRIYIRGIANDLDLSPSQIARRFKEYGVTAKDVEIAKPDPPDLLEKEFNKFNDVVSDTYNALDDNFGECFGECTTPKQVLAEFQKISKFLKRAEDAVSDLQEAFAILQEAAEDLAVKSHDKVSR